MRRRSSDDPDRAPAAQHAARRESGAIARPACKPSESRGRLRRSGLGRAFRSRIARAGSLSAASGTGDAETPPTISGTVVGATSDQELPSKRVTTHASRRTLVTARAAIVSKTGWVSVGERAITRRISLVAVCCSSDSVTWHGLASGHVFSCSLGEQPDVLDGDHGLVGEGLEDAICLAEKGWTSGPSDVEAPSGVPSRSSGVASDVRMLVPGA